MEEKSSVDVSDTTFSKDDNIDLITSILSMEPHLALTKHHFCIVDLSKSEQFSDIIPLYNKILISSQQFFAKSESQKKAYVVVTDPNNPSTTNSLYGYSAIINNKIRKEQFMVRCFGPPLSNDESTLKQLNLDVSKLKVPKSFIDDSDDHKSDNIDFGRVAMELYTKMDGLCRDIACDARKNQVWFWQKSSQKYYVDSILEPIADENPSIVRKGEQCYNTYLPKGYISTSILDCYYYSGRSDDKSQSDQKRNRAPSVPYHSLHADTGLMTCLMASETPAFEIPDPSQLSTLIPVEKLLHQYISNQCEKDESLDFKAEIRKYAFVFWGESVKHPLFDGVQFGFLPLVYQIGDIGTDRPRFEVVLKQRTAPLFTFCRYQEDYLLRQLHEITDDRAKDISSDGNTKKSGVSVVTLMIGAAVACATMYGLKRYFFDNKNGN